MYLTVRHYRGSGEIDAVMTRVARDIVPLLRAEPGFIGYWACHGEDGEAFSITVFEDRAKAGVGNNHVQSYVKTHLSDLLPAIPDIYAGEVRAFAETAAAGPEAFASVAVRQGLGPEPMLTPRITEVVVPTFTAQPGFRAYFTARLDDALDTGIVVSLWTDTAQAKSGLAKVAETVKARLADVVPDPVRRIAGPVRVAQRA